MSGTLEYDRMMGNAAGKHQIAARREGGAQGRIVRTVAAFLPAACIVLAAMAAPAHAQTGIGEKRVLEFTRDNWVSLRDFNGRQLIYFTHLVAYRCGIDEVRYSINNDRLGRSFTLPPCTEKNPNAIPAGYLPYISLPPGTANEIYVQLTFSDGSKSETLRKVP